METVYDSIVEHVPSRSRIRTPDDRTGKPFIVESTGPEGVVVRTARGGRVEIGVFTFETAVKYLRDFGCVGEKWLPVKDENFQMLLNMENDRVRASSYVVAILGAAGIIDVDGSRPNRVRLASAP